jgi:hypothetical protein
MTGVTFGQSKNATLHCEKVLDTLSGKEIFSHVDVEGGIVGGMDKLYSELAMLRLPRDPDIDAIRIFISFIIEPNGEITSLSGICKAGSVSLDKQLLELFKKFQWKPAICSGVKVPSRLVLSVKS